MKDQLEGKSSCQVLKPPNIEQSKTIIQLTSKSINDNPSTQKNASILQPKNSDSKSMINEIQSSITNSNVNTILATKAINKNPIKNINSISEIKNNDNDSNKNNNDNDSNDNKNDEKNNRDNNKIDTKSKGSSEKPIDSMISKITKPPQDKSITKPPITKPPIQPITMPKHINTADGTILLSKPSTENKTSKVPSNVTNKDTIPNSSNKKQSISSSSSKTKISPPLATSLSSSDMSRSASVQGTKIVSNPYQTMQRTSSVPIVKKTTSSSPISKTIAPVPIAPHPNGGNSGVYFHPIAIKPRPIQPLPTKNRSKSNLVSRPSNSHISKNLSKSSDSSITLTTSKNWVLPPRPKTKKALKKKERKPISSKISSTGIDMKYNNTSTSSSSKVSTMSSISKTVTSAKKPSSPLANQINMYCNTPSPTESNLSSSPSSSSKKSILKTGTSSSSKKFPSSSSSSSSSTSTINNKSNGKSSESKSKKCTDCTRCIAPGIRSVYLEPSTGKVSINAQIHSNINLYTNDEGELEVQLQHVSRENDNLKKILLKLNKEIQNLKIVKRREENAASKDNKAKELKSDLSNKKNSSIKLEQKNNSVVQSKNNIKPIVVKKEEEDVDVDVDMDIDTPNDVAPSVINSNNEKPIQIKKENEEDFSSDILNSSSMKSSANTIDPVNLSYNLDSKRQKLSSTSPDVLSCVRPSMIQSEMDIDPIPSTVAPISKAKTKKVSDKNKSKTTTTTTTAVPKSKTQTKSKLSNATDETIPVNKEVIVENKTKDVKKEYHSCGVCEVGQKCVCFESQTLSIAATIAQALSHGGVNLLGLGGLNNSTMNTVNNVNSMSNITGLNTLTSILKREEIMKRLKDDDKKTLTTILKNESSKIGTSKDDKANLNTILNGLTTSTNTGVNPEFNSGDTNVVMNENICGINTMTDATMIEMKNHMLRDTNSKVNNNKMKRSSNMTIDKDDELLQMIDAELLLDPTPIVNPILLRKDLNNNTNNNNNNSNNNNNLNKSILKSVNTLQNDTDVINNGSMALGMNRSESKNSQHSFGTNAEFIGRGTLMDFNVFNGGDPMIDDDAMMFDPTSYGAPVNPAISRNDVGGDLTMDIEKILMEPIIDDTDDFMIY
ncbi:hypothetical protein C6P40_000823 [Pichia californica]|uniref:Hap4 transcription factor heteromerisation domain-containing protein n=1 Tax=Pichia californica TaxID=460514 RepID=A0A9P6WLY2_9ASCO|nr:hypothetical protein C6P40_000823 [[Candida] californica]